MAGVLVGVFGMGTWSTESIKDANDRGATRALELNLLQKQKEEDKIDQEEKQVTPPIPFLFHYYRPLGGAVVVLRLIACLIAWMLNMRLASR